MAGPQTVSSKALGFDEVAPAAPPTGQAAPGTLSSADLGFDPVQPPAEEGGLAQLGVDALKGLGRGIVAVGRRVDSVTGAPTRAAIGSLQDGGNPLAAFAGQFGEDPELAPTGKEIAAKAGLSTQESISLPMVGLDLKPIRVSPAGVAGFGIDVAADPTNFVPASTLAKVGAKAGVRAGSEAAVLGIKGAGKATDVLTGTEIGSRAVKATGEAAKSAKLALSNLFSPKRADDYEDLARIAARNNIDLGLLPEAVEFGPSSLITRASRVRAEGPLGQGQLEAFNKGLEQTKKAAQTKVARIGGGRILSQQEAGDLIREGYDQAVERVMRGSTETYGAISRANPGLRLNPDEASKFGSKLDDLGRFAESRVKMGMTSAQKAQAKQLQEAVESLKGAFSESWERGARGEVVGQPLFDDMVQRMQILGEAAFKKKGGLELDPPDVAKLRNLYGDMREAVIGTIEKDLRDGPKIAQALRDNNAKISAFLDERGPLERALGGRNVADETVYRQLVENGDSLKLEALSNILTPEQLQQLKGTFLNNLLRPDFEDDFTFGRAINSLRSKQGIAENLLSPEEIKEFTDLLRLGDRFGQPVMSTSGTGASMSLFKDLKSNVQQALVNDTFIGNLKNRARAGSAPTVKTANGELRLDPSMMNQLQGAKSSPLRSSAFERRLKGAQVMSVAPFDENEERRDAMRRRAEKK
jgi:hypothetical protein